MGLLSEWLHFMNLPFDKQRGAALSTPTVAFQFADSAAPTRWIRPPNGPGSAQATDAGDARLVIAGPDEEIVRFVSGRHFVPGARPGRRPGTPQDLAALRRAFR